MLYWYTRNSTLYSALRKDGDSTWLKTYQRFYSLMETSSEGTNNGKLQNAYSTYLDEAGFDNATLIYNSTATWNSMYIEVSDDYPFHFVVQDHYLYKDHSVLGVGYDEYNHGTLAKSRYIRVADGWTSSCDRYIHTREGVGQIRMVSVRPQ